MMVKFGEIIGKGVKILKEVLECCLDFRLYIIHPEFNKFMKSLPGPLSTEETEELLKNRHSIEARNKLIEGNTRLVLYIMKKFNIHDNDIDDVFQMGTIAIMRGIEKYDESRNVKLNTYLGKCAYREIQKYHMDKCKYADSTLYIDEPTYQDEKGSLISISDFMGNGDQELDKILLSENHTIIENAKKILKPKDLYLIESRFADENEKSQPELAEEFEMTQSGISRREKKCLEIMRKNIPGELEDYVV